VKTNPNCTVIITGASSGIGKALALKYASEGYNVVINGRKLEALEATSKELSSLGNKILLIQGDVSKEEDCRLLIDKTMEVFG